MGYKLSHHPLISLFEDLLNLYSNKQTRLKQSNKEMQKYFKADMFQLLKNPYFGLLLDRKDINLKNSLRFHFS